MNVSPKTAAVMAVASLAGGAFLLASHKRLKGYVKEHRGSPSPNGTPSKQRPRRGSLPETVDDAMRAELNDVLFETNLYEAITQLLEISRRVLSSESVALYIVDPLESSLHACFSLPEHGRVTPTAPTIIREPLSTQSITTFVATTGKPLRVNSVADSELFSGHLDSAQKVTPRNLLAVPLVTSSNQVVAVLQVANKVESGSGLPGAYCDEDMVAAQRLCKLAGNLLHRLQMQQAEQQARSRMRQVMDLTRQVSSDSNAERVVEHLLKFAKSTLHAERATLFLVDHARQELEVASSQDVRGLRMPIGQGLAGFVAVSGRVLNIPDAYTHPRFDASVDKVTGFRTASVLAMPIRDEEGTILAVLMVINRKKNASLDFQITSPSDSSAIPGNGRFSFLPPVLEDSDDEESNDVYAFSSADEDILEYICSTAGFALKRAKVLEKMDRARRTTEAVLRVLKAVSEERDLIALFTTIIDATYELLAAERVTLFLVDNVKAELYAAVSKDLRGARIKMGEGLVGHAAATGLPLNIRDAYTDARFNKEVDRSTGFRTRAVLCIPVCLKARQTLAVVQVINKRSGKPFFDEQDEAAMEGFCQEVAIALKRNSMEAALVKLTSSPRNDDKAHDVEFSLLESYAGISIPASVTASVRIDTLDLSRLEGDAGEQKVDAVPYAYKERIPHAPSVGDAIPRDSPLRSWDFDVFKHDGEDLVPFALKMFKDFDLLKCFNISESKMLQFINRVREGYRDNPFHNWYHGWSVMHAAYLILSRTAARAAFPPLEVLTLLTSALCHDLDHPGHNNAFETATASERARRHSFDSILERHHLATAWEILSNPKYNIFAAIDSAELARVRKMFRSAVLATDMVHHGPLIKSLNVRLSQATDSHAAPPPSASASASRFNRRGSVSGAPPKPAFPSRSRSIGVIDLISSIQGFDIKNPEDRELLCGAIVHTADLSGQAYAQPVALQWGERVLTEFKNQVVEEKRMKIPSALFMEGLEEPQKAARVQKGFVQHVVIPLWSLMAEILPGLQDPLSNLHSARLFYKGELRRYKNSTDN